ncbi:tetratricopeptide repeat protein [Desulfosarcina sp.]|uniref:tetratricopeptide repeat protein n=1 Tax=Desulfosarcina sp. TaxID=2027861 RepID=UPI003970805D
MARHSPDLFKNRSATQEFLYSHSDDGMDDQTSPGILTGCDGNAAPRSHFADMLDRTELLAFIDTHLHGASKLCAIAVRFEWAAGVKADDEARTALPEEAIIPIATICQRHRGAWSQIARNRITCVLPQLGAAEGRLAARHLLDAFQGEQRPLTTIGVATYPTINFTRSQTVENAEKALEHAGFIGPGTIIDFDAVSLNISGDRHYQAGDIAGAMAEYQKGLRLDPVDMNLHNSLGVCHGVLKDYDNALTAFDNAIWLSPQEMMAIYNKGYILLLKGKREQALECFLDADAREPNVFEVIFHLGQTFMEMGATEKARPYLEAASRANRRSGPACKSLGRCLEMLGLTKEAIQAYKRAVKINPVDAESLSILGRLYSQRGESLDVASVLCEQSVRLSPDNGIFRHRLGHVYLNQGKLGHALAEFELAVALGHDSQPQIAATQDRMMEAKAS